MLNLFKLKNTKNKRIINVNEKIFSKNFPPSVREWNNSIYVYNKNALNLIPVTIALSIKLIKSYFNLYNYKLERIIRKTRLLRRFKRISSHKFYVSNGEFKHTNNKVIITLYIFNRQKQNYKLKIEKRYKRVFRRFRFKLKRKFKLIKYKGLNYLKKAQKKRYILIKTLNVRPALKKKIRIIKLNKNFYSTGYITKFYKKIVKKSLRKLKIYLYYKQLLFINKSKFNFSYLQNLKYNLEKLYNKNVEFSLVNLKYFYLNSDILSESITLKIKKNRKKLVKKLKVLIRKVKIRDKKKFLNKPHFTQKPLDLNKLLFKPMCLKELKTIPLKKTEASDGIILHEDKLYKRNENREIALKKKIYLNNRKVALAYINYKYVTGVRVEAAGRLTRRYTASRAISKLRYKGNLININSSLNGLSSVMLRGNLRSNLQYSKLKSKTRIGSFGIKGWVSGN